MSSELSKANPSSEGTIDIASNPRNDEDFDDKTLAWGWRRFKPKWLQWLNSPKWFLFFVCWFMFVSGCFDSFVSVALPTLEKRFKLTSKQTGLIVASNDITAVIIVVFVGFYGNYGHKTKWLGYGSILAGISVLLFALPKLLIGKYQPTDVSSGGSSLCVSNVTQGNLECNTSSGSNFNVYLFIFVICQLLVGVATTPLFSLGPAYLDENVHPKVVSWYLGFFYLCIIIGPGAGSMIGGRLLSTYVDIVMPAGLNLTPRDHRWIGAWWLGPLFCSFILLIVGFILLGFPAKLPGSEAVRKEAIEKGYIKKDKLSAEGGLKNFFPHLKDVLTNWTFIFQCLGTVTGTLQGFTYRPFLFKLLTQRYGSPPFEAGASIAIMLIPSAIVGVLVGSFIIKKLGIRDSCRRAAKATFFLLLLRIWVPTLFLIPGCNYAKYAGADVGYTNSSLAKFSLSDQCNSACHCSTSKFRPLCGPDGVSYFSPCFAGCTKFIPNKSFANCSCANPLINKTTMVKSDAVLFEQTCRQDCSKRNTYIFVFGGFMATGLGFVVIIPTQIVTIRSVGENQRALALGVQFALLRLLASIPGPVIAGAVIDATCTLWSTKCGVQENCLNYDFSKMGLLFICALVPPLALSLMFLGLSWFFSKNLQPKTYDVDNAGKDINDDIIPARLTKTTRKASTSF